MWSCTREIREVQLLNGFTDTSGSCCREISAFTSQQSLLSVPWGTQHPPLLPSSSRGEEKGLFTGYFSTQHAAIDTYMVQNVAFFIFMQFMTKHPESQSLALRSASASEFLSIWKELSPFWRQLPCIGSRSPQIYVPLPNVDSWTRWWASEELLIYLVLKTIPCITCVEILQIS